MHPKAIVFGSIGTLAETSELQREAFNLAFAEAGLDWHWDEPEYREMLKEVGGRNRIASYAEARGIEVDGAALHSRKTEIFDEMLERGGLSLRPGVRELIDWAKGEGIPLAMASTTSRENLNALFAALNGIEAMFDLVTDAQTVRHAKPDPEVFRLVCHRLNVEPSTSIGIEDTAANLASPLDAGLRVIAFPGAFAIDQDFSRAHVVVDRLGPEVVRSL